MKRITLLKPCTVTDSLGQRVTITADDIAAIAAAYDPQLHEAPVVIGHPAKDGPAYGWAQSLEVSEEGELVAVPHQVDPAFAELVEAGRYKKISAALYGSGSSANPTPGRPYLRHIGFFGAHPPAVKGLKPVELAEDGEALLLVDAELADAPTWSVQNIVRLLRNVRSYFAEKEGEERAEEIIPNNDLDFTLESLAHREGREAEREYPSDQQFSETGGSPTSPKTDPPAMKLTPEEEAKLEADRKAAEKRGTELAEREAAAEAREKALADREAAAKAADDKRVQEDNLEFAERLAGDGARILPRHTPVVAGLLDQLMGVASADTIELGEGDDAEQIAPADALRQMLAELPKNVEFSEVSKAPAKGEQTLDLADGIALGEAASQYIEAEAAKGRTVSASAAVAHVKKQQAA